MSSSLAQRPGSVTAVVFLTWLAAILDVISGAVLVFFADVDDLQEATGSSATAITTAGWVVLVIGLLVALVATRLARGGSGARMLVTILMLVRVGAGITNIILTGSHGLTESLVTVVVSAAVLYLLWTGPSSDWFASR